MTREELDNEIEWFLNLRDAVEDDKKQAAIDAINAAIALRKRQKKEHGP
jgi:hypothetical protein